MSLFDRLGKIRRAVGRISRPSVRAAGEVPQRSPVNVAQLEDRVMLSATPLAAVAASAGDGAALVEPVDQWAQPDDFVFGSEGVDGGADEFRFVDAEGAAEDATQFANDPRPELQ